MEQPEQPLAPDSRYRYEFPYRTEWPESILAHPDNPYLQSRLFAGATEFLPSDGRNAPSPSRTVPDLEPQFLIPYHNAELVEPRIRSVRAGLWTTVTNDNVLVHNLLHYYFLCQYPSFAVFSKDAFLDDIVDGRPDYCSKLLVNSILASAW